MREPVGDGERRRAAAQLREGASARASAGARGACLPHLQDASGPRLSRGPGRREGRRHIGVSPSPWSFPFSEMPKAQRTKVKLSASLTEKGSKCRPSPRQKRAQNGVLCESRTYGTGTTPLLSSLWAAAGPGARRGRAAMPDAGRGAAARRRGADGGAVARAAARWRGRRRGRRRRQRRRRRRRRRRGRRR